MTGTHPDILNAERTKTSIDAEIRRIDQHITSKKNEIRKLETSANSGAQLSEAYRTLAQLETTREKLQREVADLKSRIDSMKQR